MTTWPTVALAEVATIDRRVIEASAIRAGSLYVGLENILPGGRFAGVREVDAGELASSKFAFTPQHLLYGKLRPYLAKVARPNFSGICSTDILPVKPGPRLDRSFLAHLLLQRKMIDLANSLAAGVNLPRLSPARLAAFEIPLPSVGEQRRIAAILDQADALRTQRRTALARLQGLVNAVFRDMFVRNTDSAWPVETIANAAMSEAGAIRTGPFGSQLLHSEFVDAGIAVLGIDNVATNEFRWAERRYITEAKYARLKRYTVKPGDVLITIMGTCGRCAVVPDAVPLAINTKHLCCITVDRTKVLPQYLHSYFLRHPTARRYLEQTAKGAIMSGLNMGIIQAMPLIIPPIEIQTEFVERLGSIESLKASHRASLAHLDALFASLQDRAFRGELFA